MTNDFTVRKATTADIPFLVDTIIAAEKSGTDILTYSTIFGLSETETKKYLEEMLREEVDGCELSVSSFLLAEKDGEIAAAVGAWVEGDEGVPSSVLKGNLLNYTLPKACIEKAVSLNNIVKELHIEYFDSTLQIGLVYTAEKYRGVGLAQQLIEEQIKQLQAKVPALRESYVQVFGNNIPAIRSYQKSGYKVVLEKKAANPDLENYFPGSSKVLMKRDLF